MTRFKKGDVLVVTVDGDRGEGLGANGHEFEPGALVLVTYVNRRSEDMSYMAVGIDKGGHEDTWWLNDYNAEKIGELDSDSDTKLTPGDIAIVTKCWLSSRGCGFLHGFSVGEMVEIQTVNGKDSGDIECYTAQSATGYVHAMNDDNLFKVGKL